MVLTQIRGIATIGDGVTSVGDFNGNSIGALRRALSNSLIIYILPGTYYFEEPIRITEDGVQITCAPGAVFKPYRNTFPYGVFHVDGADRFQLNGGSTLIDEWVDDQIGIWVDDSLNPRILDHTFEVSTADGSALNPMSMLKMTECVGAIVRDNRLYPNTGVRGWYFDRGTSLGFQHNYAGPKMDGGIKLGAPNNKEPTPRNCYRVLDIIGMEHAVIGSGTTIRFLGDYTTSAYLDRMISYVSSNDTSEEGHIILDGIVVENVDSPWPIYVQGAQFAKLNNIQLGATPAPRVFDGATNFQAAVTCINIGGGSPKTTDDLWITNCNFHNCQSMSGTVNPAPVLYLSGCSRPKITNNTFELVNSGPAIIIYADTIATFLASTYPRIWGNHFQANPSDPGEYPIYFVCLTGGSIIQSAVIGSNTQSSFSQGWGLGPIGVKGPIMWHGLEFDEAREITGTMALVVKLSGDGTHPRITGTGLFTDVLAGDCFELSGAADDKNNGFHRVYAVDGSSNYIDLETQAPFADFIAQGASTGITLKFHPRINTNLTLP